MKQTNFISLDKYWAICIIKYHCHLGRNQLQGRPTYLPTYIWLQMASFDGRLGSIGNDNIMVYGNQMRVKNEPTSGRGMLKN